MSASRRPEPASRDGGAADGRAPDPLVARGLCKRFGAVHALDGVDLDVGAGEVVALVGRNGSGKTTVLHVVAGLLRPDGGSSTVAGAPSRTLAARRSLAIVPDEPGGVDELTVAEHVALLHSLHRADAGAPRRASRLAASLGLDAHWQVPLRALSRGQRRQASIVASLSLQTPLVLVDEATATLDPNAVAVLAEALAARARAGAGVLVATQDLAFARRACDRALVLERGRVVAQRRVADPRDLAPGSHEPAGELGHRREPAAV